MDAKELMIGDILNLSEEGKEITPCIVTELRYDELVVMWGNDKSCDIVGYDMVRPIYLTAEILEKNGFKKEAKRLWSLYDGISIDASFTLGEVVEDGQVIVFRCSPFKVKYVHELQHALRLCVLEDLADNFKIN